MYYDVFSGPINTFLSHPCWQPLSRLTFSLYLSSLSLQLLFNGSSFTPFYMNHLNVVSDCVYLVYFITLFYYATFSQSYNVRITIFLLFYYILLSSSSYNSTIFYFLFLTSPLFWLYSHPITILFTTLLCSDLSFTFQFIQTAGILFIGGIAAVIISVISEGPVLGLEKILLRRPGQSVAHSLTQ